MQGIEGMEELFLGGVFARNELDVVDQQNINIAIAIAELFGLLPANGVDQVVGELFARHIQHIDVGILRQRRIADGVQQVGFAQTDTAIQKQRVVRLGRMIGHCHTGGTRQPIARTDDKAIKRKALIEHATGGRAQEVDLLRAVVVGQLLAQHFGLGGGLIAAPHRLGRLGTCTDGLWLEQVVLAIIDRQILVANNGQFIGRAALGSTPIRMRIGTDDDAYTYRICQNVFEDGGNHAAVARLDGLAQHRRADADDSDVAVEVYQLGATQPCIVFAPRQLKLQRAEHTIPRFGQIHGLLHRMSLRGGQKKPPMAGFGVGVCLSILATFASTCNRKLARWRESTDDSPSVAFAFRFVPPLYS